MNCRHNTICLLLALVLALPAVIHAAAPPLIAEDFLLLIGDTEYTFDMPAATMVASLEKLYETPMDVSATASCLFEGEDKEYANDELLIGTCPRGRNGEDVVETILILGGLWRTTRGIGIGDSRTRVIDAYGEPSLVDHDQLIYAMGSEVDAPQLIFQVDLETDTVLTFALLCNSSK